MTRCCLCRDAVIDPQGLERTDLPGTGWRCHDRHACSERIRSLIDAHKAFAQVCEE